MSERTDETIAAINALPDANIPRCAQRTGKECRDCCECLSALPAGLTCETGCRHVSRCKAMFGQKGTEAYCQFIPSRFYPLAAFAAAETENKL